MTKDLRPAIIRAHEKGKGVHEIARFLDISPATVSRALTKASNEIPLETLIKTVDDFLKRLAACIAANGGYFE